MRDTFFNLPPATVNDVVEKTIALIGSKVFTKSIHKPYGVWKAAKVIRNMSKEYSGYLHEWKVDIHEKDVVDLGDYDRSKLGSIVKKVIDEGGIAIVIGGDHATTYYALKNVDVESLLWLDAHLDLAEKKSYYGSERINHANVLQFLLNEKELSVTIVGFRGHSTPKSEINRIKKYKLSLLSADVDSTQLSELFSNHFAISLDLDFFDATEIRATRVPEINGFSLKDFIIALGTVGDVRARYFDIVEYCPDIDRGYVDAKVISQVLLYVIALFIRSGYG